MAMASSGVRPMRLAPDWLPNTNHAGFYVANALGYYRDAGIGGLEILPFEGEAMPNRKIASGETEFGLMPQQSILSMRARGIDVVSVAALVQPNVTTIMVRDESDIRRPADFAGRRYAAFGTDFEVPMLDAMIRHGGGAGSVVQIPAEKLENLQALYDGETDLAWGFYAWEGIQAELAGPRLRHFFVAEHGVPPEYFPLLFTTRALIAREPETVRALVAATERGYAYAAEHPTEAAEMLLRAIPRPLLPAGGEEVVRRSLTWLAPRFAGTLAGTPSPHPWGYHDPHAWAAFAAFIRGLPEAHELPPTEPEAEERGFTNAFVGSGDLR